MGLESVQIILECESRFGISIGDDEARDCRTVGDLQALVAGKLPVGSDGVCLSLRAFHRLRDALIAHSGAQRSGVRPRTRLADAFAGPLNQDAWSAFQSSAGLRLPRLVWPRWAGLTLLASGGALLLGAVLGVTGTLSAVPAMSTVAGAALAILLLRHFEGALATSIPDDLQTIGDLASRAAVMNAPVLAGPDGGLSLGEIRDAVADVVAVELGVDPSRVVPEAEFVGDLGMS